MPFYEVAEAAEVSQETYLWTGDCKELAIVLQRELGITEDVVPAGAKFMQLTSFQLDDPSPTRNKFSAMVAFYDENMNTVTDGIPVRLSNFVI